MLIARMKGLISVSGWPSVAGIKRCRSAWPFKGPLREHDVGDPLVILGEADMLRFVNVFFGRLEFLH